MKIETLRLNSFRGVPNLEIELGCKSTLVVGKNGVGKSTIADAIDFLFTGHVARLEGDGMGEIDFKQHIPHVKSNASAVLVSADVVLSNGTTATLTRRLSTKKNLEVIPLSSLNSLEFLDDMKSARQHLLTRRELLRFISVTPGNRAEQVQTLLNWGEIELARSAVNRTKALAEKAFAARKKSRDDARAKIVSLLDLAAFGHDEVLGASNLLREKLGLEKADTLSTESIGSKSGLLISEKEKALILLQRLVDSLAEHEMSIANIAIELNKFDPGEIARVTQDDEKRLRLYKIGAELTTEEATTCPLCDKPWAPGELVHYLSVKIAGTKRLATIYDLLHPISARIVPAISALVTESESAISLFEQHSSGQKHVDSIRNSIAESSSAGYVSGLGNISRSIKEFSHWIAEAILASGAEVASDRGRLAEFSSRLSDLLKCDEELEAAERASRRALILANCFEDARVAVADSVYDSIAEKFSQIYIAFHENDADSFSAQLKTAGPALDLRVKFHDVEAQPAMALHSEGHQDSMGIAMFFALRDLFLIDAASQVLILDDVVMSIDASHRRAISKFLKNNNPSTQLIITTHDDTWAIHLCQDGVVNKKTNRYDFLDWSIERGPTIERDFDLWKRFDRNIQDNDVSGAAAVLRRGFEQFFSNLSALNRAKIVFKPDGKAELGDLMKPACARVRDIFKIADAAARTWGNADGVAKMREERILAASIAIDVDLWEVNSMVHYDPFCNLSREEMIEAGRSYKALYDSLTCDQCDMPFVLATAGKIEKSIGCGCGKVSHSLVKSK